MQVLSARHLRHALAALMAAMTAACSVEDTGFQPGAGSSDDGPGGPGLAQDARSSGSGGRAGGAGGGGVGGRGGGGGAAAVDAPVAIDAPADRALVDVATPVDVRAQGADAPVVTNGAACGTDGACASGFCVDGVCCDTRCSGPCVACVRAKTGQESGVCRAVTAGTDVDGDCPDDGAPSCKRTGLCDGSGACTTYPANTACGTSSCSGHTYSPTPRCNGAGACIVRPPAACAGNLICANTVVCKARCALHLDCTGGLECDVASGVCRGAQKQPNGASCDQVDDCLSGFCVDGVCCNEACSGSCRSCAAALTGGTDGRCAFVPAGKDPTNECAGEARSTCGRDGDCDGAGACRRWPDGTLCATDCCKSGGGARPCSYQCSGGACNKLEPVAGDRCPAASCCCPAVNGAAMCVVAAMCPGGAATCL